MRTYRAVSATRRQVRCGEDGQALTEYVLVASLVALGAFIAVTAFGEQVYLLFETVNGLFP